MRKELAWALEREAELGHTFVLPVVLDEQVWQLVEPAEFRRRKYVKCTDYSAPGIRATADALKENLFAFASRRLESSAEAPAPKSMAESMAGVLKVYHSMATRKIEETEQKLMQELELLERTGSDPGIDRVLLALDQHVAKLRGEERDHSQRADEMRVELSSEPDEKKKNFASTIGLMVEGTAISAKGAASHIEKLRTQFRLLSKQHPELSHIDSLRRAITQLKRNAE